MIDALILPGIGNSGPQHWQTLWEKNNPTFKRMQHSDWNHPVRNVWVKELETTIAAIDDVELILVAHSLACLLVAHWAASTSLTIKGALLVAVPDPHGPQFPEQAVGFSPLPRARFTFPSIIVAGSNDPYSDLAFTRQCAADWGCQLEILGAVGHINADSQLGEWPEGSAILQRLHAR